jgi:PST family polysaccharide transporter
MTSRVLRGATLAGGGYAFAQALNLGVYVVLARLLTPADFGVYAAATVLFGFGVLFTESGMQAAVVQRRDRLEEAQSTAVVATLVGGVIAALVGLAAAPLLGALFDSDQVTELALVCSGLALVNVLAVVPNAILQRRFSFLRLVVVDPIEVCVFGAVAIVAATQGMGPWALVIGQYAALATSTTLSWGLARWRPKRRLASFAMWRELAGYGRHVLAGTAIMRIGEQAADTLIIGKGIGTAALGQFRYAFRIAALPYQLLLAGAGYVVFPAMARIQGERERLDAAFLRSLRWLAAIGLPAGMILVPLAPSATALIFGEVWLAAGYAAVAMCAYAGASAIVTAVGEMLKAVGNPAPLVRLHAIATGVTALTMLALVPFGLTAAAAGLSAGAVAGAAYAVRVAARVTSVSVGRMWHEIWRPALAAVVMGLAVLPLDRFVLDPHTHGTAAGLALLAAEGVVCIALFVGLLRLLAPATLNEVWRETTTRLRRG